MAKDTSETPDTAEKPAKKKTGRPTRAEAAKKPPRVLTFFEQINKIDTADWGTRASIKIYRLEPIINKLVTQDNKYVGIYNEPVTEERIKLDHGSGRYRLYLNYKMPGPNQGIKEVDSIEFDIMDTKFPPNLLSVEWVEDHRNKKWAWAKTAIEKRMKEGQHQQPQASGAGEISETLRVFNEIQDSAAARAAVPMNPLDMIKAVKELMPAPPPPSSENGMFNAVVQLMTTQMDQQGKIMAAQIATAQEESRELRAELRAMRDGSQKSNGIDTFKAIIGEVKTLIPDLKELFPTSEVRARGPWWAGVAEQLAAGAAPLISNVGGQLFSSWLTKQNGAPAPNGMPALNPGQQPQRPPQMSGIDLDGMLLSALAAGETGDEFAHVLNTYHGDQGKLIYRQASAAGEEALLSTLKTQPVWQRLGPLQEKMPDFIKQFIAWDKPESDALNVESEVIS